MKTENFPAVIAVKKSTTPLIEQYKEMMNIEQRTNMHYTISKKDADEICEMVYDHGFKAYDKVVKKFEGLLAQPEGEPVAWMTSIGRLCSTDSTNMEQGLSYGWKPLYTHPAPFTSVTADDVTDEMVDSLDGYDFINYAEPKALIAATVNAYMKGQQ